MADVLPSEFKRGMALLVDGAPQLIQDIRVSGSAQTKHKIHVRLRNLQTGRVGERTFADNERVPTAELQRRRVQYSYAQADQHIFLDLDTYEEWTLNADQVGERIGFLKEDVECRLRILDGRPVDLELPPAVALQVVETAPPQSGVADNTWKPAKLETGIEIMVPPFIASGETVRVDTREKKYLGKEHEKKE